MKQIFQKESVRYIIVGVLTTAVNFSVFEILQKIALFPLTINNIISIVASICFAYWSNARFVFNSQASGIGEKIKEFSQFFSARLVTMIIEVVGVYVLAQMLSIHATLSKIAVNVIVLILNYFFSKWLFTTNSSDQ